MFNCYNQRQQVCISVYLSMAQGENLKRLVELLQRVKLQLRWKLLGGFLLANLLFILALVFALITLFGTTETLQSLRASNQRSETVTQINVKQNQLVNNALDYMWSKNLTSLKDYENTRATLDRQLAAFQPAEDQKAEFAKVQQQLTALRSTLDQMITLRDSSREKDADNLWRTEGTIQLAETVDLTEKLQQQEKHSADNKYTSIFDHANFSSWLITSLAGLALLIAVGWALLLTVALSRPIAQLKSRLAELANRNLTRQVQIVNNDELGELSATYNTTLKSLHEVVQQLYVQSQQVSSASEDLTLQALSQVTGSSQQAKAISEATQTLEELSLTAEEIAQHASQASQAAECSLNQVHAVSQLTNEMMVAQQQGRVTVAQTIEALQKLKKQMTNIENQQRELVSKANVIQRVVATIDELTRETHLLALNAAIEAAGASQAGNRFRIVAHEIKALSERASRATSEIRANLGDIVQAVNQVSEVAEQGLEDAKQAVEQASHSDVALITLTTLSEQVTTAVEQIVKEIEDSSALTIEIGIATRQQQMANAQLLDRMTQIEAVTVETLSKIKQSESTTQQLNLSAQELKSTADSFKLTAAA
jgi:methyl-accepting chemotaxis protein